MNAAVQNAHDDHHEHTGDKVLLGFWIYILSDCLLFATFFAVYTVMGQNFAGAPEPKELFDLGYVGIETILLLVSSFTFGMAMLAMHQKNMAKLNLWLVITFLLGAGFLAMELNEFHHFLHEGARPSVSGYWTAFYSLVGTHGLHVTSGLVWMLVMFIHLKRDGLTAHNTVRISCLSLFWHFLDIIWICVFSYVYLMGVM